MTVARSKADLSRKKKAFQSKAKYPIANMVFEQVEKRPLPKCSNNTLRVNS